MTSETSLRLAVCRAGLASLPQGETRAAHAVAVVDRYLAGAVSMRELVRAGAACRHAFLGYAAVARRQRNPAERARYHAVSVTMYSAYDVADRIANEYPELPTSRPSWLTRVWGAIVAWMMGRPCALPEPAQSPYRTLATIDGKDRT